MNILNCQEAFGTADMTSKAMQKAIEEWFDLYYRDTVTDGEDPCQRIAYTVISKLVRTAFAEYGATAETDFVRQVVQGLNPVQRFVLAHRLRLQGCWYALRTRCTSGKRREYTRLNQEICTLFAENI